MVQAVMFLFNPGTLLPFKKFLAYLHIISVQEEALKYGMVMHASALKELQVIIT